MRRDELLIVIASNPVRAAVAIRAHLDAVRPKDAPPVATLDEASGGVIVVCPQERCDEARSGPCSRRRQISPIKLAVVISGSWNSPGRIVAISAMYSVRMAPQ